MQLSHTTLLLSLLATASAVAIEKRNTACTIKLRTSAPNSAGVNNGIVTDLTQPMPNGNLCFATTMDANGVTYDAAVSVIAPSTAGACEPNAPMQFVTKNGHVGQFEYTQSNCRVDAAWGSCAPWISFSGTIQKGIAYEATQVGKIWMINDDFDARGTGFIDGC